MATPCKYAVLELGDKSPGDLFNLLVSNGYGHVTFLPNLHEHPAVRNYNDERDRQRQRTEDCRIMEAHTLGERAPYQDAATFPCYTAERDIKADSPDDDYEDKKPEVALVEENHFPSGYQRADSKDSESGSVSESMGRVSQWIDNLNNTTTEQISYQAQGTSKEENESDYEEDESLHESIDQAEGGKQGSEASSSTIQTQKCMVCKKRIPMARSDRPSHVAYHVMMSHAKTHCEMRQFACPSKGCSYTSVTSVDVRRHMKLHHDLGGRPNDKLSVDMQDAWKESFELCYPNMKSEMANVKFKVNPPVGGKVKDLKQAVKPGTELCLMCRKIVPVAKPNNPLSSGSAYLVHHAKLHCAQHQFFCIVDGCGYSHARNSWPVTQHMKMIHKIDQKPENRFSPALQQAWMETFRECFPDI